MKTFVTISLSDLHRRITEALVCKGLCTAGNGDAWEFAKEICDYYNPNTPDKQAQSPKK